MYSWSRVTHGQMFIKTHVPFFIPRRHCLCLTHINYILTGKKRLNLYQRHRNPFKFTSHPLSSFPQQANNSTLIAPVNFRRLKFSAFRDKQKKNDKRGSSCALLGLWVDPLSLRVPSCFSTASHSWVLQYQLYSGTACFSSWTELKN